MIISGAKQVNKFINKEKHSNILAVSFFPMHAPSHEN